MEEEWQILAKNHDSHKQTSEELAAALDSHKEDIDHREMQLENMKLVRDTAIQDLA